MKNTCKCAIRAFMTQAFTKARTDSKLTQAKFAEKLMMDVRSYAALEHGDNLCCFLTFILFITLFCKDTEALISDLRKIVLDSVGSFIPSDLA